MMHQGVPVRVVSPGGSPPAAPRLRPALRPACAPLRSALLRCAPTLTALSSHRGCSQPSACCISGALCLTSYRCELPPHLQAFVGYRDYGHEAGDGQYVVHDFVDSSESYRLRSLLATVRACGGHNAEDVAGGLKVS